MRLQEIIIGELNKATTERNISRRDFLKVVVGELGRMENKNVSDADVLRLLKKMRENALMLKNDYEVAICDEFLPKTLNEGELTLILNNIIDGMNYVSMRDMGKIMSALSQHPNADRIDKKLASELVKKILV